MQYIRVQWRHSKPDMPVELYSELDDERWEIRKVEVFPDGRLGYAGPDGAVDSTMLGLEALPPLQEMAADPEFRPAEISREEFEAVWEKARRTCTTPGGRRTVPPDEASVA